MEFDYRETEELRAMLDENGVFWMDVERVGMRRTCFKLKEQGPYWYADQVHGQGVVTFFCETWMTSRVLEDMGLWRG